MNALKLIESVRTLTATQIRMAELKAELKTLEKKEETTEKQILVCIGDKIIQVEGKLLSSTHKPKGVRLGDQELIEAVMEYDSITGEIVAELAEKAKLRKSEENKKNAPLVLVVTDAPKGTTVGVISLTLDANGQVTLAA